LLWRLKITSKKTSSAESYIQRPAQNVARAVFYPLNRTAQGPFIVVTVIAKSKLEKNGTGDNQNFRMMKVAVAELAG
jgi:hypothetical protein